ncbi:MAG: hypothetical protein WB608_13560 [Terracidiphilus sp.]
MKTVLALLGATTLCLSASGQSSPPTPDNWGPTQQGVRVSLSLDKSTYAVDETIPLYIKAQIVSAERPLYAVPDRPTFIKNVPVARAFHLTIIDEKGRIVGNDEPSNLQYIVSGSSGPLECPVPLEVGRVYYLGRPADIKHNLLPTLPGTYRLTVTWSPYPASDPPCDKLRATSDSQELRSFVTVSSLPITIRITGNP